MYLGLCTHMGELDGIPGLCLTALEAGRSRSMLLPLTGGHHNMAQDMPWQDSKCASLGLSPPKVSNVIAKAPYPQDLT